MKNSDKHVKKQRNELRELGWVSILAVLLILA